MKYYLCFILIIIIACSKDSSPTTTPSTSTPKDTTSSFSLYGRWLYSDINNNGFGRKLDFLLNNQKSIVTGNGVFYYKYNYAGQPQGYSNNVTLLGTLNYPSINYTITGADGKVFNYSGYLLSGSQMKGFLSGYLDNVWGNIKDSLLLTKQ